MRDKVISLTLFILLSVTIFSTLSSNSYSYFKEHQNKMFIGDDLIVKFLDGEKYQTTSDVVDMLNQKNLQYVIYYVEDNTYYVLKNEYDSMLELEMKQNQIIDQTIGEYSYLQLDLNDEVYELFIAVKGYDENQVIELFNDGNSFLNVDGSVALFSQAYEGMMNLELYLTFITLITVILLMFLSLYISTQKEKIGVMKILGFSPATITRKYLTEITVFYIISLLFIYIFNFEYLNFVLQQNYVFEGMVRIIYSFIAIVLFTTLICGAVIYYYINNFTAVKFIREVSYD